MASVSATLSSRFLRFLFFISSLSLHSFLSPIFAILFSFVRPYFTSSLLSLPIFLPFYATVSSHFSSFLFYLRRCLLYIFLLSSSLRFPFLCFLSILFYHVPLRCSVSLVDSAPLSLFFLLSLLLAFIIPFPGLFPFPSLSSYLYPYLSTLPLPFLFRHPFPLLPLTFLPFLSISVFPISFP